MTQSRSQTQLLRCLFGPNRTAVRAWRDGHSGGWRQAPLPSEGFGSRWMPEAARRPYRLQEMSNFRNQWLKKFLENRNY